MSTEEHFVDYAEGVDNLNASDFSSARLVLLSDSDTTIIDQKRFYKNLAGLVIHDRSTMLEFTDINTDVNHGITPFKNISDEYQYHRFKSIREYGSKCELTSIKEGLI